MLAPKSTVHGGSYRRRCWVRMVLNCVSIYVRGETYLALHDGDQAATEFQKFIDHRGVVGNFLLGALARLGLARAYAVEMQSAQGEAADADPYISFLKQAKAEYARLRSLSLGQLLRSGN